MSPLLWKRNPDQGQNFKESFYHNSFNTKQSGILVNLVSVGLQWIRQNEGSLGEVGTFVRRYPEWLLQAERGYTDGLEDSRASVGSKIIISSVILSP